MVTAVTKMMPAERPWAGSFLHASVLDFVQAAGTRAFMQVSSFIVMIALARALGPEPFGIYAFGVLVGTSVGELVLGMGVDIAAMRVSAPYWERVPQRAWAVFQLVGAGKLVVGLGLMVVGLVGAEYAGDSILGRPELVIALRTAFVAALAVALTELGLAILQARQRLGSFAAVGVTVALLRALPLLGLVALGGLTVGVALTVYVCSLYLGSVVALAPSQRRLREAHGEYRTVAGDLWRYAGWLVPTVVFGTVANTVDTLALSYYRGASAVGVYAAARAIVTGVSVLTMASLAVLLPRFGRMSAGRARRRALGRAAILVGGLAVVVAGGVMVAAAPLVSTFYGRAYEEAVPVLRILGLAYALELATTTLVVLLLVEGRPDLLAKAAGIGLVAALAGYAGLVPSLGALGAALVLLGGRVVGTVFCLVWAAVALSATGPDLDRAATPPA
jgi:O-antigen/teichoic acid export membrane protein